MKETGMSLKNSAQDSLARHQARPLEGLYGFVRNHLAIANSIVLAAGTLVAILDFLGPRLSLLPVIVYSATLGVVAIMGLAAFAPELVARSFSALGYAARRDDLIPLWRRPLWQASVVILLAVSAVGFASIAKASEGGMIASHSPTLKSLQSQLLSLDRGMADISRGVAQANDKLDKISLAIDPNNPADRCADLGCAVMNGASPAAVRKLIEKGAKVPGDPVNDGAYLLAAALSANPGRFQIIDMLAAQGIDKAMLLNGFLRDKGSLTKAGAVAARDVVDAARMRENPIARFIQMPTGNAGLDAWNDAMGCFLRTSGGVSLLEVAALMGDADLARHVLASGVALPKRPLACAWQGAGKGGSAKVLIDAATGAYQRATAG